MWLLNGTSGLASIMVNYPVKVNTGFVKLWGISRVKVSDGLVSKLFQIIQVRKSPILSVVTQTSVTTRYRL